MKSITELNFKIYKENNLEGPSERRDLLIKEMAQLEKNNIHCKSCNGKCCTFQANSMQVTPLEAFEILVDMKNKQFNFNDYKSNFQNTIKSFRLDQELFTSKKNSPILRKTYTCPFFKSKELGCVLSRKFKPYGCLAFNAKVINDNGKTCFSNTSILEKRESEFVTNEIKMNELLKSELKITWLKKDIPTAMLELMEKIYEY